MMLQQWWWSMIIDALPGLCILFLLAIAVTGTLYGIGAILLPWFMPLFDHYCDWVESVQARIEEWRNKK